MLDAFESWLALLALGHKENGFSPAGRRGRTFIGFEFVTRAWDRISLDE